MSRTFNVYGDCKPGRHYMVDIRGRLDQIKDMVDQGLYFTINRARQYGKTTTLRALERFLKDDYLVVSMDFQMMSYGDFVNESAFVQAFCADLLDNVEFMPEEIGKRLDRLAESENREATLSSLFRTLSKWCGLSKKGIVLLIDEVDSATNNQVFLDFLAQLRGYYLNRDKKPTFQSVILAGVYDVRNVKRKIRSEEAHKVNSPWNIAADFPVDMSFSVQDILGMLKDYENDHHFGMNVNEMAELLLEYTSGYPFLVSRLCKWMDERVRKTGSFSAKTSAWTKEGLVEAVKLLLMEKNTLFESMAGKLRDYPELRDVLYHLLFQGKRIAYNPDDPAIDMAMMFGFVKVQNGYVEVSNRLFETRLYNMFLTLPEVQNMDMRDTGMGKSSFLSTLTTTI